MTKCIDCKDCGIVTYMLEHIGLGSAPHGEDCAQVGEEDYAVRARAECQAYINQLRRILFSTSEPIPQGFQLRIKSNLHDFGTYYEVEATFKDNDDEAANVAYFLDSKAPEFWDAEALQELGRPERVTINQRENIT